MTEKAEPKFDVHDRIRYLACGLGGHPAGYDSEAVIADQMERRGHTGRDARSVRIGFQIGYQEGFLVAAKYALDTIEMLGE